MIKVNAISIGKIETLSYGNYKPMQSALNKIPFKGQMWLNRLGFVDDEQAYHKHGGIHKAICCFSKSNYQLFKDDLDQLPEFAMFGENLTVEHLDEADVYFGNQYQLGDTIIEVSDIREPCWKIQAKYAIPNLVQKMTQSGKTGFYFRVIKEGYVHQSDNLKLIKKAKSNTRLSVKDLNHLFYNERNNLRLIYHALRNPYLSPDRKKKLQKMKTRAENRKFIKSDDK